MNQIANKVKKILSNIPGYSTERKIIVIESDDWGSERFPNKQTVDTFIEDGYPVYKCGFSYNDCLETNEDIHELKKTLVAIENEIQKKPKLTLLTNVANPDFKKIRENSFNKYYSKTIKNSYKNDDKRNNVLHLLNDLLKNRYIDIEYHGRQHLYVDRWMRDLMDNETTRYAFRHHVSGISPAYMKNLEYGYRAAYDLDCENNDVENHNESIVVGIKEFKDVFKKNPTHFVAPDGPFPLELEKTLKNENIRSIGKSKLDKPPGGNGKFKYQLNWLGKKTSSGLIVTTRNVGFEPMSEVYGDVNRALDEIKMIFALHKPAVVSTHRANYVGNIHTENRDKGLNKLKDLMVKANEIWPDTEFLTTNELVDRIINKK